MSAEKAIFLSASVPVPGRGDYADTSNPFLIQCAVRELVLAVIEEWKIVWGGHPAITPMLWTVCQDLNLNYSERVVLYQSKYFEDRFPDENEKFKNTVVVEAVRRNREESLRRMRVQMLTSHDFKAAVFIGGMDGVEDEYRMFGEFHRDLPRLVVAAPGGAALKIAKSAEGSLVDLDDIDFARLFRSTFVTQRRPER